MSVNKFFMPTYILTNKSYRNFVVGSNRLDEPVV